MVFTQITWQWNGWAGAPGYSVFRGLGNTDSTQTNTFAAALRTFLSALTTSIPTGVTLICLPDAQVVNDGDGSLVEIRPIGSLPSGISGSASGNFSGATGAAVAWKTAYSTGRRLLQAKTFLVPLAAAAFSATGVLSGTTRTAIINAAQALIAAPGVGVPGHLVAWHRPKGGAVGHSAEVTAVGVNAAGAVLRSRRD